MTVDAANALNGRRILVSGATGFLGKVFVAYLLERFPDLRITLLVRPRGRVEPPIRRVERMIDTSPVFRPLRARHGQDLGRWLSVRLDSVAGDVEKPHWGLAPDTLNGLLGTDLVVHCAGLTDFAPDPLRALAANTAGAVHALDVARALRVRLVHVSTAFVCGARNGLVDEAVTPSISPNGKSFDPAATVRSLIAACKAETEASARTEIAQQQAEDLGWVNVYTLTKGLAEHLLALRGGRDVVMVRPSIVECARRFPFAGWNEGLNTSGPLAWLISTAFRHLPARDDVPFDVVPVDDVAIGLALACSAALRGTAPAVLHLASSDVNRLTLGRTVELTGLAMRKWSRSSGSTLDRLVYRHLDPIAVAADENRWDAPGNIRGWLADARALLDAIDPGLAPPSLVQRVTSSVERWQNRVTEADEKLERVERMLDLYRPFIHDFAPVFRTESIRRLSAETTDPALRFDVTDIDWRRYWIDVEYPGLRTWCIPLVYGHRIPADAGSVPALRIQPRDSQVLAKAAK